MTTDARTRGRTTARWAAALAVAAFALGTPEPARAQTAAALYEQAQAREAAARKAPTLAAIRAARRAYETVVLRHPRSGYCDNALWQGAGLAAFAWERFGEPADRADAERLLAWLRREYPSSGFVRQVGPALAALAPPAAARAPAAGPGPAATIRGVTATPLPRGDRITVELSHEVAYSGDRIANPDRVFFDFARATVPDGLIAAAQATRGSFVTALRLGRHADTTARLVLELAGQPRYSVFPLYDPFRLVIDIEGEMPPAAAGTAPAPATPPVTTVPAPPAAPPPASRPVSAPVSADAGSLLRESSRAVTLAAPAPPAATGAGGYSLARQLGLGVSRIVIDPGHGGHDPGARANGLHEAEVVLDIALRLEALLKEHQGFEVTLTRRTDEFVPLEARTEAANRADADLFLSIHANASPRPATRGIETYFLNFATNPEAEAVAARENAASGRTMRQIPALLNTIALNSKLAESRELATIVQTSLVRRARAQSPDVPDLGVKQALFSVLIGAEMPSVLAEVSFLTNRTEAALLKQGSYRQRIAQALFDAIVRYQGSLKKVTTGSSGHRP